MQVCNSSEAESGTLGSEQIQGLEREMPIPVDRPDCLRRWRPKAPCLAVWGALEPEGGGQFAVKVLIDTGADVNLVRVGLLPPENLRDMTRPLTLTAANAGRMAGGDKCTQGLLHLRGVEVDTGRDQGLKCPIHLVEADITVDAILSYGWLAQHNFLVNPRRHGICHQDTQGMIWIDGIQKVRAAVICAEPIPQPSPSIRMIIVTEDQADVAIHSPIPHEVERPQSDVANSSPASQTESVATTIVVGDSQTEDKEEVSRESGGWELEMLRVSNQTDPCCVGEDLWVMYPTPNHQDVEAPSDSYPTPINLIPFDADGPCTQSTRMVQITLLPESDPYMPPKGNMPHVLDLFAGTGSVGRQFSELGYEVISLDFNPKYRPTICCDILTWNFRKAFPPDYFQVIACTPPCTEFSAAMTRRPRQWEVADQLVLKALEVIVYFQPDFCFLENPPWWTTEDAEIHARTAISRR